jgi:hypothetical protein
MCMTYEQSCGLWYRKLKLKVVRSYFNMIWNYDHFSKWNYVESSRICTFKKESYLLKKIQKN